MALKTFVARKGLESGGGVYFKSRGIAGSEQLTSEDFFIDCLYTGAALTVALPQINNTGEQRQIIVLRNSTGDTVNLVTVTGYSGGPINASTPFIYLKNGQTVTFQVNYDYSGWLMTADYSFIQEDVAVGSTYRILNNNSATGAYSTVSGGLNNTAGNIADNTVGLGSTVSGGIYNIAISDFSTVAGGSYNTAGNLDRPDSSVYSTVSGGGDNVAGANHATVAGGGYNRIPERNAQYSTISGGTGNLIDGTSSHSVISGGRENSIQDSSSFTTISGGYGNSIDIGSGQSTISGGYSNTVGKSVTSGTISGGVFNGLENNSLWSVVSGGYNNIVNGFIGSTISGGTGNRANQNYSVISGGTNNSVYSPVSFGYGVISGGLNNMAYADFSVISGGIGNTAGSNSVVSGGAQNAVIGHNSVISGGSQNSIDFNPTPGYSVISGGYLNRIRIESSYSVISGGTQNVIGNGVNTFSNITISGGANNTALANRSTVSGGTNNTVNAAGSTISGGTGNTIFGFGIGDVISGGSLNRSGQSGTFNTVAGGLNNSAGGSYTFIGGGQGNSATGSHNVIAGGQSNSIRTLVNNSGILGGSGNTVDHGDSFIIGSSIVTKRASTTHVNNLDVGSTLNYTENPGSANSSGEVVYFGTTTAGVGMTAGFVYEYGGTGTWGIARADASANANGLLGIALGSSPATNGMLLRGFARYTAVSSYTAMGTTGGPVYLSKTANQFTQTAPGASGDIVRIIGYCVNPTTDILYFAPDTTWITLTT